ncbi:MAG: hypothetical protein N2Z80_04605 [Hydrogenothermaceae bacterium]|nr:hypothetical protein [Hydrogenothermaceae bacterium]
MKDRGRLYTAPTRVFRLISEGFVFYYRLTDESKLDQIDFPVIPSSAIKGVFRASYEYERSR